MTTRVRPPERLPAISDIVWYCEVSWLSSGSRADRLSGRCDRYGATGSYRQITYKVAPQRDSSVSRTSVVVLNPSFNGYDHPRCTVSELAAYYKLRKVSKASCEQFRSHLVTRAAGVERVNVGESVMPRPLYGRRTSSKPSHTSPDITR